MLVGGSVLIVEDKEYPTENIFSRIKSARDHAADLFLLQTGEEIQNRKAKISNSDHTDLGDYQKIYLIDLESVPCFTKQPKEREFFFGFIEELHATAHKYSDWYKERTHLFTINSGYNDCVDHLITSYCYPLAQWIKNSESQAEILVVSRDKAARCTIACLENFLREENLSIKVTLINDLLA